MVALAAGPHAARRPATRRFAASCLTISALCVALTLAGCASNPEPAARPAAAAAGDDLPSRAAIAVLDATLWMQTSAEYAAMSRQTWAAAARLLPEALADTGWTAALEQPAGSGALPAAVIVDVDETVLDNSPYAARLIRADEGFSEATWAEWVDEARARPVPGAVDFARRARELGVEVFYVTNRLSNLEDGTRANLLAAGFPPGGAADVYLLKDERADWGSDKTSRRRWVAERYRVLMLMGDDLNDFTTGARGTSVQERARLVERHADWWGSRWFAFANPTYGSWASALEIEGETPEDVLRGKVEALDPARAP